MIRSNQLPKIPTFLGVVLVLCLLMISPVAVRAGGNGIYNVSVLTDSDKSCSNVFMSESFNELAPLKSVQGADINDYGWQLNVNTRDPNGTQNDPYLQFISNIYGSDFGQMYIQYLYNGSINHQAVPASTLDVTGTWNVSNSAITLYMIPTVSNGVVTSVTWEIYDNGVEQLPNHSIDFPAEEQTGNPVQYSSVILTDEGGTGMNFTSGHGLFSYSMPGGSISTNRCFSETWSGDSSNMGYGSLTCTESYACTQPFFAQSNITVSSVNQNGEPITGFYSAVKQSGTLVVSNFTPMAFGDLVSGETYTVEADSYGDCTFTQWSSGSTSDPLSFTATSHNEFEAMYDCNGSVTVNTINTSGQQISGYYTTLSQSGNVIASGYSDVTFTGLVSGQSYVVHPQNYGSCDFAYWQDNGNTNSQRSFSATSSGQTFTAVYSGSCHT